jgi:hypothetical protein
MQKTALVTVAAVMPSYPFIVDLISPEDYASKQSFPKRAVPPPGGGGVTTGALRDKRTNFPLIYN